MDQDSSCLTTGPQPGVPMDPGFPPRFSGLTGSEGEHIPQVHTHTQEGTHRALSGVPHSHTDFQVSSIPAQTPSRSLIPCLNPGPHDCWLPQPAVCWRMTVTALPSPSGDDADTGSPRRWHEAHGLSYSSCQHCGPQ